MAIANLPSSDHVILTLGSGLSVARRRRRLKQGAMAQEMGVSRQTLHRLEHGDATVSLAVLASALSVLGLASRLEHLLAPEKDLLAIDSELDRLPQRIRSPQGI